MALSDLYIPPEPAPEHQISLCALRGLIFFRGGKIYNSPLTWYVCVSPSQVKIYVLGSETGEIF